MVSISPFGPGDRLFLHLQRVAAFCAFLPIQFLERFFLKNVCGFEISSIVELRRDFAAFSKLAKGRPILICGNHLTLVDSLIQAWALAGPFFYFFQFASYPWSLPEYRNFYRNPFRAIMSYFHKGLPVKRGGGPERTERTFHKIFHLLSSGETVSIFPEGRRSPMGRVSLEPGSYAVGRILQRYPEAQVLCVYMRGEAQDVLSDYPRRGERFHIRIEPFEPIFRGGGLRQRRDLSLQVLQKLAAMECVVMGAVDARR